MAVPNSATYLSMLRAGKAIGDNTAKLPVARVALLADHAPQQLEAVLAAALAELGYHPVLHSADYATAALEVFDTGSSLHAFKAEIVVYSLVVQKYRERFYAAANPAERDALPRHYLDEVLAVVDAMLDAGMSVLLNNLVLPIERMFGNFGAMTCQSLYGSVFHFNSLLLGEISRRPGCQLHDMMYLGNAMGARDFLDERVWSSSKYPCASQFLPEVARSMARAITAYKGRLTKVLVLDLDNTLWGGTVGDDGANGVALGGDAYGESFQQFQRYILALRDRGYVLAVCSKNDEEVALEVFRTRAEMLIKEQDISVFVANWNDKASNLDFIAASLQLSSDSFVFLDDSAFERHLVKATMAKVAVPELPEDVADFPAAIELGGYLEATAFTAEDQNRNSSYRQEAQRSTAKVTFGNIDDYLGSLDMQMQCSEFSAANTGRVAQLIQRSTQFNLRTQRLSEAACLSFSKAGKVTVAARLADRFGDYGLIAAVCCDIDGSDLFIAEWVMSCRVLKRGVEDYLMNQLFVQCRQRGLRGIRGEYIRSEKNSMVQDFYKNFGFEQTGSDGSTVQWFLALDAYQPKTNRIREAQS